MNYNRYLSIREERDMNKFENLEALVATVPTIMGITPAVFVRGNDGIVLSGEEGDGLCDYWGEGGESYIHTELEKWAAGVGAYWEWENAGCAILYKM
jgi:hypothetical protein